MNPQIEVIVAAMHQCDFSLVEKMNLQTDAIIANQCEQGTVEEKITPNGKHTTMVSTPTRGVGKNRNIGLIFSSADILVFADQDVVYVNNMPSIIKNAFDVQKKADIILFGFNFSKGGEIYQVRRPPVGKIPFYKSLKYGTYAIAIRRKSLLKKNIMFTELFGGGCPFSHGEDSDFIVRCYKSGLKVYGCNEVIGTTSKDESTCFNGYNEKYFFDTGALAKNTFGLAAPLYICYMAIRTRKITNMPIFEVVKLMVHGYRAFNDLRIFEG